MTASNVISFPLTPFAALRIGDVFQFTKSLEDSDFSKNGAKTGTRYYMSQIFQIHSNQTTTICEIVAYNGQRDVTLSWDQSPNLLVRNIGTIFGPANIHNIPLLGDLMIKPNGKKCPRAKVRSLCLVGDVVNGWAISVQGSVAHYYIEPENDFSLPCRKQKHRLLRDRHRPLLLKNHV